MRKGINGIAMVCRGHRRQDETTSPAPAINWKKRTGEGNLVVIVYGFKSGGSGGSSRIRVMVTRRFADNEGSSGNSGWVSALPETA